APRSRSSPRTGTPAGARPRARARLRENSRAARRPAGAQGAIAWWDQGAAPAACSSAGAFVQRAIDLHLDVDVAAQEVVVALAEVLHVAALAALGAEGLRELAHALDQLAGVLERLDDRALAGGLDQLDAAVLGGAAEGQHDQLVVLALHAAHHHRGRQGVPVLRAHPVMGAARPRAIERLAGPPGVHH